MRGNVGNSGRMRGIRGGPVLHSTRQTPHGMGAAGVAQDARRGKLVHWHGRGEWVEGVGGKENGSAFPASPHWLDVPAHCVDGTLLVMVHSCAARSLGGKLDATLCWGVLIHTTICRGGTNCHA